MERILQTLPPVPNPLRFLPPKNLCSVLLTSSSLKSLASDPKLWSDMTVRKSKIQQEGLKKLFSIVRFTQIRKIDISGMTFTLNDLMVNLNAIIASASVEDLNLESVDISQVPASKLSQVVGPLHKIDLTNTKLTTEQVIVVMEACASSTTLKKVSMNPCGRMTFSEVPSELLAQAPKRLNEIKLEHTRLTTQQCIAVLEACKDSTTLMTVSLMKNNFNEVPSELLGQAVQHLHEIDLYDTELSTEQIIAVLKACASSTTLVGVFLGGNNHQEVPSELLGQAAKRLHEIDLECTELSTEQCIAVLEACTSSTTLKKVSLGENNKVHMKVPNELLARAKETGRLVLYCDGESSDDDSDEESDEEASKEIKRIVDIEAVEEDYINSEEYNDEDNEEEDTMKEEGESDEESDKEDTAQKVEGSGEENDEDSDDEDVTQKDEEEDDGEDDHDEEEEGGEGDYDYEEEGGEDDDDDEEEEEEGGDDDDEEEEGGEDDDDDEEEVSEDDDDDDESDEEDDE